MRIAQIAPPHESVPPARYGGTERVIHALTEELVKRGHEVTLFASGDSRTSARLVPVCERALRLDSRVRERNVYLMLELGQAFDRAWEFDLIHSHVDFYAFPFTRFVRTPVVHTLHGRLDMVELPAIFEAYPEVSLISISNSQRTPLAGANWLATVYHGVRIQDFMFRPEPGRYLAFLGRIAPEKGVERAIASAIAADLPLRIAAKVDEVDREYFEAIVKPMLDHPLIEFLGEIGEEEKDAFLGEAYALVFSIDWPEPFGLVLIEAMACGTPVVAVRRGSVPEIVRHGQTGFICESPEEIAHLLPNVTQLDRRACRAWVEEAFTAEIMAERYEAIYQRLLARVDGQTDDVDRERLVGANRSGSVCPPFSVPVAGQGFPAGDGEGAEPTVGPLEELYGTSDQSGGNL